ncbi:MAG: radical SAM protein [Tepidisphaeraceae bacterium]|jgi:threonylcarbamoyladenosine tRNA methylthiotransferase MtaB
MRTFCIITLGCKVNQYESEQIATVLRSRGLIAVRDPADADLRIVNTCSVTVDAASKSRQSVRRMTRLPVLTVAPAGVSGTTTIGRAVSAKPQLLTCDRPLGQHSLPQSPAAGTESPVQHVVVMGCWATSNKPDAQSLPGVSAVIGHDDDVAASLNDLLDQWTEPCGTRVSPMASVPRLDETTDKNICPAEAADKNACPAGTTRLPLLAERQTHRQRALLKIQDGCDAHCTYCIIPRLRTRPWSKPVEQAVAEARRLVDAGHQEIVLTGIFLGAYGQSTTLRRRQQEGRQSRLSLATGAGDIPVQEDRHSCLSPDAGLSPLARLIDALCTGVPALRRLRLSSLEPGDLSGDLLAVLRSHPQITPHFHVPLQSGSDAILRRMNRQYTRDDFLAMIDQVRAAFDRPAFTTDIIVGFPGETDAEFERTLAVVAHARFIHIHAFPFSPRPGTAAARWGKDFVRDPLVNERIHTLSDHAAVDSLEFRRQFIGQTASVMLEPGEGPVRFGRCERYFSVHFDGGDMPAGRCVDVRIDRVTPARTHGSLIGGSRP